MTLQRIFLDPTGQRYRMEVARTPDGRTSSCSSHSTVASPPTRASGGNSTRARPAAEPTSGPIRNAPTIRSGSTGGHWPEPRPRRFTSAATAGYTNTRCVRDLVQSSPSSASWMSSNRWMRRRTASPIKPASLSLNSSVASAASRSRRTAR